MISRPNFGCSHWLEFVYMRILSWRHFACASNWVKNTTIVLGDGGHHGTVNNNGCQELPLIPPVWITSTNRHAHLIPWPFQHPIQFLDFSNIQPTWFLDLSNIQSNSLTFPTSKGKWALLLVEVIQTGGISGNSWQPLLFTVPRWPPSPSTINIIFSLSDHFLLFLDLITELLQLIITIEWEQRQLWCDVKYKKLWKFYTTTCRGKLRLSLQGEINYCWFLCLKTIKLHLNSCKSQR